MSLSSTSLPKPKNWQNFESSIRELFIHVLNDPNTQQNGRSGQPQSGVDVYGYRDRKTECLVGVQCKKKFENKLTEKELKIEFNKAKTFKPKLSEFILVTTAPRDQKIQATARAITQELATTDHPIFVNVWGWEDVEENAAKHDAAWKAFDPTWNPFAERSHEKLALEMQKILKSVEMISMEVKVGSPIPVDEPLNEENENTPRHGQITAFQSLINDGHVHPALQQLTALKNNEWAHATRTERYRILVAISSAKLKLGVYEEAGQLLLDAYNECPEHKKAKKNRATALLLTKQNKGAIQLSREILAEDQNNAEAAGILIQAMIDDISFDDPLSEVPEALLESEEVQIAYVHFLRCRDNVAWVNTAKNASMKYPGSRMLKLCAAEAVLDELVRTERDATAGGILKNITYHEINEATETLYGEAREAIDKGFALLPSTAHNAALAQRFFGDLSKAKEILDAAISQHSLDESLRLQRAIIAYTEHDLDKVLSLFSNKPTDPEAIGIFVETLDALGRQDDALDLINDTDESNFPEHVKVGFLEVRIRAYLAKDEKQLAIDTISQRVAMAPGSLDLRVLQIRTYHALSKDGDATNALEEAIALVNDETSLLMRLLLSVEANDLGHDDAIINLLKGHVATDRESKCLHNLLITSINSGHWVTAGEILASVPESMHGKEWFLRADAMLAFNTGDTTADGKIARYLRSFPNNTQMILIRLGIWQRAGRDNDIRKFLQRLNLADLVGSPEQRIQIAAMLTYYGVKWTPESRQKPTEFKLHI